jgi:hypothetical protein
VEKEKGRRRGRGRGVEKENNKKGVVVRQYICHGGTENLLLPKFPDCARSSIW